MNRVFKTKWSAAHQQYVVTDEHHATKGKAAKSAVAIAVAAFMMAAGAQAAYKDPNPNISSASVAEAQRAFETAEYQKDWGQCLEGLCSRLHRQGRRCWCHGLRCASSGSSRS